MSLADLKSLVLQAPLSQLTSVLADIRGLLAASSSSGANPRLAQQFEDSLPEILREFHEQQGKVIRLPGLEEGSIISSEGSETIASPDGTHAYRDAGKSKRFTLDHLESKPTSNETYRPIDSTQDNGVGLRNALDDQLQLYLSDHYPELDKVKTNEGAAGQVWLLPLTVLQFESSGKKMKMETQKTAQEEAMAEKLQEDQQQQQQQSTPEKDASSQSDVERDTYGGEQEQKESPLEPLHAEAEKELRSEEVYSDDDEEEDVTEPGDLVEQPSETSGEPRYVIKIVSGKSNAGNFWSGRLLSTYTYTPSSHTLSSHLKIQIHYYENGNVQLNTLNESPSIQLPPSSEDVTTRAKAIISAIKKFESKYQELLDEAYFTLNYSSFKNLRRVLPVTKQKLDWDKLLNYRLGSDLAEAQSQGQGQALGA